MALPVQKRTPIDDSREPTVREEATLPERVTAENPAQQMEEGGGSEPRSCKSEDNTENTVRIYARVRHPPKRLADYQLYKINDRRTDDFIILRQMLEATSRLEERYILLNCISNFINKLIHFFIIPVRRLSVK